MASATERLAPAHAIATMDRRGLPGRADGAALVRFRLPEGIGPTALPLPPGVEVQNGLGLVTFRTDAPTRVLTPVFDWATERGLELDALTVTRPSLEDVYLELTDGSSP